MIVYAAITTNDPKQQPMQTASCDCYLLSDALLTIQSTKLSGADQTGSAVHSAAQNIDVKVLARHQRIVTIPSFRRR